MSFPGVLIAGLVATLVFYVTTRMTTMNTMGMERLLATAFTRERNMKVGFVLLFIGGVLVGLIYAALWSIDIGWPDYLYGLIFGIAQWLVVGLLLGLLPVLHTGIRSGALPAPGLYMTNLLGGWAFVAGLVNHVIFGLVFAYFYQFFRSRYG